MKSILTLCVAGEIICGLLMLLSVHFQWNHQVIPYFAEGQLTRSYSQSTNASAKNHRNPQSNLSESKSNKLLDNFEEVRKDQLNRLNLVQDIHPMMEKSSDMSLKTVSNAPKNLPSSPRNFVDLKITIEKTFWELQPNFGVVWFNAFLEFPIVLRILALIPPLWLPLLILSGKFTNRKTRDQGYQTFLKSLRGLHFFPAKPYQNFENAYALWKIPSVQNQFQKEKRSLKKQWFKALIANGQRFDGLNFGSTLIHENQKDLEFSEELCITLLQGKERIDRRYSSLLTWYLSSKGTPELARFIYERTLQGIKPGELDHSARILLRKATSLCPHPELQKHLKSCE